MAKHVVLIVLLSLIVSTIVMFIIFIAATAASYQAPEIHIENHTSNNSNRFCHRLLQKLGYQVDVPLFSYNREKARVAVITIEPDEEWYPEWEPWLQEGKRLIVLVEQGDDEGREDTAVQNDSRLGENVSTLYLIKGASLDGLDILPESETPETVMQANGRTIVMRNTINNGELIMIADDRIISDASIIRADNAVFINNCLLDFFPGPVLFGDSYRQPGLADQTDDQQSAGKPFFLFEGLFLGLFLQLMVFIIIFFLIFWKRYGPVLDTDQFARRSLLIHLKAAGSFFEKTKRTHVVHEILYRHFMSRLRDLARLNTGWDNDIIAEVRKRIPAHMQTDLSYATALVEGLYHQDQLRERIIQHLKGVE